MSYSRLSRELTKRLPKEDKKKQGIYFTPRGTVSNVLKYIRSVVSGKNLRILEPSCGSGEFLTSIEDNYPEAYVTAIEKNKTIFKSVEITKGVLPNMSVLNEDYLNYESSCKYDLIIGNPPYFVMKKGDVDQKYYKFFEGRPNIFNLFIVKALGELTENGVLCYVLPKSFLNCLYYNKTRLLIYEQYEILNIINCDDENYIETNQETFVLVLRNSKGNNKNFSHQIGKYIIFGEEKNIRELRNLKQNSCTLSDCGFDVKVGSIVWNQCKDILTNDSSKTRLIYSSDIVNHTLTQKSYEDEKKKNYIRKEGGTKPSLVVNRGYGSGKYSFEYCLIEGGFSYLVENHLICIVDSKERSDDDLLATYGRVIKSFEDPRTKKFIELYFGNSAMNTTELKQILPIYGLKN